MTSATGNLRALLASRPFMSLGAVAAITAVAAFSCDPTIPSPDHTVWGCYSRTDGHLIVIDHEAGETCPSGFSPLNWQGSVPGSTPSTTTTVPTTQTTVISTTSTTVPQATTTTTSTTEPPPPG